MSSVISRAHDHFFKEARKQSGLEYLETIVRYLAGGTDGLNERELARAVQQALPTTGDNLVATLAEKWMEQGKLEGKREGKLEGKLEGLLSTIETGLELKFGEEGLRRVLPEIRGVRDANLLADVNRGLWTVQSVEELHEILHRAS